MFTFNEEIQDHHLQSTFQKFLHKNPTQEYAPLKSIKLCGSTVRIGLDEKAFLMSDGEKASFLNLTTCKSPWACPKCTAVVMAKKGRDIACVIDALKTWYDESACMITFTLPHTKDMSCKTTFSLLLETWRLFSKAGNKGTLKRKYEYKLDKNKQNKRAGESYGTEKSRKKKNLKAKRVAKTDQRAKGEKGQQVTYSVKNTAYALFREEMKCNKLVKVFEFTWGKENGWHPHIHALFWFPDNIFDKCVEYEDSLNEFWWKCLKKIYLKHLNQQNPDQKEENKKRVEEFLTEWRKNPVTGHRAVFFSKDKDGKPIRQKSSTYISGWSGDVELSKAKYKEALPGHFTTFQIIKNADTDSENREKWLKLYAEYALTTKGKMRVVFSKPKGEFSFKELIEKWKRTQTYRERLKKKVIGTKKKFVVCFFSEKQWFKISQHDLFTTDGINIKIVLLSIASRASPLDLDDIRAEIQEFLNPFDIILREPEEETARMNKLYSMPNVNRQTGEIMFEYSIA